MSKRKAKSKFVFLGNCKCIDFVNTEVSKGGRVEDLLADFTDLVAWSREAEILSPSQANHMLKSWNGTREGELALQTARELRARLRKAVGRLVDGKNVHQSAIDGINEHLRLQRGCYKLVKTRVGFVKTLESDFDKPSQILVPVAEAASDLLCYSDVGLVKKCESESCILYFYDVTKNHTRRWCSMGMCGNRMKVAAHYQRARKSQF